MIKDFEKNLIEKVKNENSEILETINKTGKLEDDAKNKLIEIIVRQKKGEKNA